MSRKNWLLLLILSFFWGSSFFFIEVILKETTPLMAVFFRVSTGAAILMVYATLQGERLPLDVSLWWKFLVMGTLNNVIPFCLIVWGQTHITGSIASILVATTPIFTALIAHVLTQDERLATNKILGILVGFVGVVVLVSPTMDQGFSLRSYAQIGVLSAAICYALAGIWGKRLRQTSPLINAAGMLSCSSVVMIPVIMIFDEPLAVRVSVEGMLSIGGIAVLSTAIGYNLYFRILQSAGATNLLLVTFLAPVSALILGMGILGEEVLLVSFYGMGIIFSGLILIDGRALRYFRGR